VLSASTEKSKARSPSAMEYMNSFFAETGSKVLPSHKATKEHHKKKHVVKSNKLRFKSTIRENSALTNATDASGSDASSGNSTQPSGGNVEVQTEDGETVSIPDIKRDETLIVEQWFMIHSTGFGNVNKYPSIPTQNRGLLSIKVDENNFRINPFCKSKNSDSNSTDSSSNSTDASSNSTSASGSGSNSTDSKSCPGAAGAGTKHTGDCPSEKYFWFRLSGLNIYYSSSKTDMNILGAMSIVSISDLKKENGNGTDEESELPLLCFQVRDSDYVKWDVCGDHEESIHFWFCHISLYLGTIPKTCVEVLGGKPKNETKVEIREKETKLTQPVIIVPLPSRHCNDDWDYKENGADWECACSEGKEQAPIDLPKIPDAIESPVKPIFQYEEVGPEAEITTLDGQLTEKEKIHVQYILNNIKVYHYKFGKVVTMDGAVYYAQEVRIHTPAEHTINGEKFDLEVQIVHYGQSVGDIAKQVVLCFLFKETPGVYNKFLDDLDIFNLPTPEYPSKELKNGLYIPKIFYSNDEEETTAVMAPFSFYTYQGSLTEPPCTESTIMYVASQPLKIGSTALKLFQEAIRPQEEEDSGEKDIELTKAVGVSNRAIQEKNGRPVFHFDHTQYCGPDVPKKPRKDEGHYEKIMKGMTNYFYVNSKEPSGLPNAFVVSDEEAKGLKFAQQ
jgi:carbonic anhydrase